MSEMDRSANRLAVPESAAPTTGKVDDTVDYVALGQATARLVHDFKNQLGGLKLYATFLKTRLEQDAASAEIVDKLVQGIDGMAVNATLVSRFARPLELRLASSDLRAMINQVVAAMTPHGAARQVVILAEGIENPPLVRLDWQQVRYALEVVVKRALNLAPPQSKVRIGLHQNDQFITLWVSEESERLSETERQNFFEWMNHERLQKTALELAHAARIVRAHGAEAKVRQAGNLTLVEFIFKSEPSPQEQHA